MRFMRCVPFVVFALLPGCDKPAPAPNPFETQKTTVEPPPITEPPKPTGPPQFTISAEGPKIGWTYILLKSPDGKQKLASELATNKEFVSGKDVALVADRNSKIAEVGEMLAAFETAGATSVIVSTDSRPEFPKSVTFAPLGPAKSAPKCSGVGKVLSERKNAVWSVQGGTAMKSPKGLAGPDMAMTGDLLESAAKRCKDSDVLFVSADEDVEWGLVYDLAAAAKSLEKAKFGRIVLLEPAPTAGRPVKLDSAP
jgi:biopolymer transport protein ExbD